MEDKGHDEALGPLAPPAREGVAPGRDIELRPRAELDRPAQLEPTRYAPRFQFLYGVLLALAITAIGAIVALETRPGAVPGPAWSSWRPTDSSPTGAQQIGDFVGARYRLPNGHQLVTVSGGPPKVQKLDIGAVVVKASAPTASDSQLSGSTLLFTLCGDEVNCAISYGKPSIARGLLLQREALELALYSFRYIGSTDNVVVILPPRPGQKISTATAVLLQRGDVASMLGRPLASTLSPRTPTLRNLGSFPDLETVHVITGPRLYHYGFQEDQTLQVQLELSKA